MSLQNRKTLPKFRIEATENFTFIVQYQADDGRWGGTGWGVADRAEQAEGWINEYIYNFNKRIDDERERQEKLAEFLRRNPPREYP